MSIEREQKKNRTENNNIAPTNKKKTRKKNHIKTITAQKEQKENGEHVRK